MSDSALLRAARSDPDAFEALFERHATPLRAWLFAKTGELAVANDLLAEAFAQAWLGVSRFRGDSDRSGTAWLYAIARHLLHQHYKRGRVATAARRRLGIDATLTYTDDAEAIIGRLDAEAFSDEVRAAFAELTHEQRLAIGYRVVEEMPYSEVASHLDCSADSARAHVSRGLRALRLALRGGTQP